MVHMYGDKEVSRMSFFDQLWEGGDSVDVG